MAKDYSPELAQVDSRGASNWLDERASSFRIGQYDASAFAEQYDIFPTTDVESGEQPVLTWPAPGYLRDYFRIQTANLRLSDSEFRPGHPGWHYLSSYISPSGMYTRGGPVHLSSEPVPSIIPVGYFILAARIRVKRQIFSTTKGYIGICPEWAKPGDSLYFADGGDVPFVLRRVGEAHFRLVGESYCHGLMSGQIVEVVQEKRSVLLV
ncbi:hypothetical protein BCR34DRAFT_600485 [Clohesyomyces aquaticus]|uniref:Uncharacterized protein n=1 Tax=Clohesyomyces aquaticus TaxID=1231657 RepID=A0A1Y1ZQR0_9PLEO|nr:hypothetical protein BCR34DRAFT_600485 [Clohesyomyces aquaticus]